MNKTQLVQININDIIKADWNYKSDGTKEEIQKLKNSISEDNSVGVLAVREVDDGFEVIDGNHRFEAIKQLGWEKVPCENFGAITKAKSITIARRRNHKWFEDDIMAYSKLFKEEVLQEYSVQELKDFMPDTEEDMNTFINSLDFDYDENKKDNPTYDESENLKSINIKIPEETYNIWLKWKDRVKQIGNYETDSKAFEYAVVEALNGTTEEI